MRRRLRSGRAGSLPVAVLLAAPLAALLAGGLLVGCGSDGGGPPVLNLYNAPQENLRQIVDRRNGLAGTELDHNPDDIHLFEPESGLNLAENVPTPA